MRAATEPKAGTVAAPPTAPARRRRAAGLLVAAAAAIVAIVVASHPWWLAGVVSRQLARSSGRPVQIDRIVVALSPSASPVLVLQGVRIANAPWSDSPRPFADVREAAAHLAWSGLVEGRPVIERLVLRDGEINLERRADGRRNWRLRDPDDRGPGRVRLRALEPERSVVRFVHGGIDLVLAGRAASVGAAGRTRNREGDLLPLGVVLEGRWRGAAFRAAFSSGPVLTFLETDAVFPLHGMLEAAGARIALDGRAGDLVRSPRLDAAVAVEAVSVAPVRAFLDRGPQPMRRERAGARPRFGLVADVEIEGGRYAFDRLAAFFGDSDVRGRLAWAGAPELGRLGGLEGAASALPAAEDWRRGGRRPGAPPGARLEAALASTVLDVEDVQALLAQWRSAAAAGDRSSRVPGMDRMAGAPAGPRQAADAVPAGASWRASTAASWVAPSVASPVASPVAPPVTPPVASSVAPSAAPRAAPAAVGPASVPTSGAGSGAPAARASAAGDAASPDRQPIVDVSIDVGRLRWQRLPSLGRARIAIAARDGRLTLRSLVVALAGGEASATASFDTVAAPPRARADVTVRGLRIESLWPRADPKRRVTGRIDGRATLAAAGAAADDWLPSLAGRVELRADDGSLPALLDAELGLQGLRMLRHWLGRPAAVPLRCASVALDVAEGRAAVRRLVVDTANTHAQGRGGIDLARRTLDLVLSGVAKDGGLLTLDRSIRLHGPLARPGWELVPRVEMVPADCTPQARAR